MPVDLGQELRVRIVEPRCGQTCGLERRNRRPCIAQQMGRATDTRQCEDVHLRGFVGVGLEPVVQRPSLGGAGALFVLGAGLIRILRRDGRADAEAGAVLALVARFMPRRGLQ